MTKVLLTALTLLLTACATPQTDLYISHMSEPFKGKNMPPLGDNGGSYETSFNAIGISTRIEKGRWFAQGSVDYTVDQINFYGGPWLFQARVGMTFGAD